MASYRQFPSQSSFGGTPPPPLPHAQPPRGTQYSQSWGFSSGDGPVPPGPPPPPPPSSSSSSFPQSYNQMHHPNSNFHHGGYNSSSSYAAPPPHHQQYSYQPPPPPPPESSYPPPPPPQPSSVAQNSISLQQPQPPAAPPMYYSSSTQYSQFSHQPLQPPLQPPPPPPPPPSPPPSSAIPPPPPLSPPPVPPLSKECVPDGRFHDRGKGTAPKDLMAGSSRREPGPSSHEILPLKQHKAPPVPPMPAKKSNGPPGRVETEEERRLRKKREFEKQRQEEKHRQQLKESQNTVLQKTQMLSSGMKGHGSIVGSRMGERRATPFLSGDRIENRLKKPTTFLCKMK